MRATAAPGGTAGTTLMQCRVCNSAGSKPFRQPCPGEQGQHTNKSSTKCSALVLALHTVILMQTQQGNADKQLGI